jgi:hypothetical protein
MERTQIYLTKAQRKSLALIAKRESQPISTVIRSAIDKYLLSLEHESKGHAIKRFAGMWKDRTDLPDFEEIRKSFDR